jgi:hypothetical protein
MVYHGVNKPLNIRGYGLLPMYRGQRRQRGYGVGGLFSNLIRLLKPVLKKGLRTITKAGKKFIDSDSVKSVGQDLKKGLLKSGQNIVADVIEGKDVKESLNKQLNEQKRMLKGHIKKLRTAGADIIRGDVESDSDSDYPTRTKKRKKRSKQKKSRKRKMVKYNTLKKNQDIFST